jgi:4-amino-4-deoxy-L-arabinose transferase-like glycosyltransferase
VADRPQAKRPWDNPRTAWLTLLLVAGLVRLFVFAGTIGDPAYSAYRFDEVVFDRLADLLSRGRADAIAAPFFLSPLWTLLLTATYKVAGISPLAALALQQLIGLGTLLLLWRLASRLLAPATAFWTAAAWALCGPQLFYETRLLADPVVGFATMLSAWSFVRLTERPSLPRAAMLGIALGLATLGRPNIALVALPMALLLLRPATDGAPPTSLPRRLGLLTAAAAACAIILAPVVWFNGQRGSMSPAAASGGINLYIGNHASADGSWTIPPGWVLKQDTSELPREARRIAEAALQRPVSAGEVNDYWRAEAVRIRLAAPLATLRLAAQKLRLALRSDEVPDNRTYEYDRQFMGILALPLFPPAGLFIALGLPGLAILLARGRHRALLLLFGLLLPLVTMLLFFVVGRYRLPWLPFLAIGAGAFVEWGRAQFAAKQQRPLLAGLLVVLALSLFSFWPSRESQFRHEQFLRANDLQSLGFPLEAVVLYEGLFDSPKLGDMARWNAARAWLEAGRPLAAQDILLHLQQLRAAAGDSAGAAEAGQRAAEVMEP